MGKTAFSGPLWGAKSLLYTVRLETVSSGPGGGAALSTIIGGTQVPVGEDWYITDVSMLRTSTGSSVYGVTLVDDSTIISSLTMTSTVANAIVSTALVPDGGEFAGLRVISGSTLTVNHQNSTVVGASSGLCVSVYGYPRFVDSTRFTSA